MSRAVLPDVWLAPGALSDPRPMSRFADLRGVPVPVGPVVVGPAAADPGPLVPGVGGVAHPASTGLSGEEAVALVSWCAGRGLSCFLAVRGSSTGGMAEAVRRVRGSLDGDAVVAVEVDLRGSDGQAALKAMARVREAAPRDLVLLARLSAAQPDLVPAARGAVAGGAAAVVVCASVPLGPSRWWSGPSTAALGLAGLGALRAAAAEQRWPGAPLVAAGGIHDPASARAARAAGAAAVQLGTALWADPMLLDRVRDTLDPDPDPDRDRIQPRRTS